MDKIETFKKKFRNDGWKKFVNMYSLEQLERIYNNRHNFLSLAQYNALRLNGFDMSDVIDKSKKLKDETEEDYDKRRLKHYFSVEANTIEELLISLQKNYMSDNDLIRVRKFFGDKQEVKPEPYGDGYLVPIDDTTKFRDEDDQLYILYIIDGKYVATGYKKCK